MNRFSTQAHSNDEHCFHPLNGCKYKAISNLFSPESNKHAANGLNIVDLAG